MKKKSTNKIELTHPDKILYPEQGITKRELADFYETIKDWILPYLVNRPLTLVRCPQGYKHPCFFQKHLHESAGPPLYTIPIKEKEKSDNYPYLKDIQGVIALVQLGVLEIHLWNCHIDKIERPDMMIFDMDPAPRVEWKRVVNAAYFIKEQLEQAGLTSFLKTTGGKGLHIVVPIKRLYTWNQMRDFSESFVDYLVEQKPKEFIGTMSKAKRKGKIFVDYFRNNRGSTSIAPFSTRARSGATVSTPISWEELPRTHSDSFTIRNLPARLARLKKDPWEEFFKLKQVLK